MRGQEARSAAETFDQAELGRLLEWFAEFDWADGCQDGADEQDIALKQKIERLMRRVPLACRARSRLTADSHLRNV